MLYDGKCLLNPSCSLVTILIAENAIKPGWFTIPTARIAPLAEGL